MSPENIPIYLQYGALGILAVWITWYTKWQQELTRDLMKRLDNLMNRLDTNAKQERDDWKGFVRSSTEALVSSTAALSQITREVTGGHEKILTGHDKIMEKLEQQ